MAVAVAEEEPENEFARAGAAGLARPRAAEGPTGVAADAPADVLRWPDKAVGASGRADTDGRELATITTGVKPFVPLGEEC